MFSPILLSLMMALSFKVTLLSVLFIPYDGSEIQPNISFTSEAFSISIISTLIPDKGLYISSLQGSISFISTVIHDNGFELQFNIFFSSILLSLDDGIELQGYS